MLRLNIRNTMPRIGIRTQLSTIETHYQKPEGHTEYVAPRSNIGVTKPEIDVDTYPSRHSYGYTNHTDFAKEQGEKGLSDIRSSTSGHAQKTWAIIDGAAKQGNDQVVNQAKSDLSSRINKQRYIDVQAIPDPTITITPSKLEGTPDPGKVDWTVDTESFAPSDFNRGKVEIYLQQKGDIRRWVSEGKYDIYA